MPETSTVDEIADVYFQGWKLGLKALAVYRDNCKVGQPLSDAKAKDKDGKTTAEGGQGTATGAVETKTIIVEKPLRRRMPRSRQSITTSFSVGGAEGYMTSGAHEGGSLGEIFLKLGKQGSTLAGVMDAFSMAISISLQYGVPLETFIQKFTNMKFEPAGMTDDADVRMSKSIMDYVFRRLALDYLDFDTRSALGIHTAEERQRYLDTGSHQPISAGSTAAELVSDTEAADAEAQAVADEVSVASGEAAGGAEATASAGRVAPEARIETTLDIEDVTAAKEAPAQAHTSAELLEVITGSAVDSPLCMNCGTKMRPAGSCHVCEGCGSTSGCS
jgi:ribonucleoside-diphosphate reductase alpha chain